MDDQPTFEPTAPSDDQLAVQLRAYADALESTRSGATTAAATGAEPQTAAVLDVAGLSAGRRRHRSGRVLGAAAVVPDAELYLLPDSDTWAVSEHSELEGVGRYEQGGIWVWRLDGHLVTLSEDVFIGEAASREQARVEVSGTRTSLHWVDDEGVGFDLQGIDVDEAALRAALATITRSGEGWDLPGAVPVVGEPSGTAEAGEGAQITLVPRDDQGVPVLRRQIHSGVRPGSEADLYRELHEASGGGTVSDVIIAGEAGYLIVGSDFSYALVAAGGWVVNWSTSDPTLDLAELLVSLKRVTPDEWAGSVAGVDDVIAQAVAAADVEPIEDASSVELPRYTLPEPWRFAWVTDMGIWTPEQRAQRQALQEANTSQWSSHPVRAQGFRSTASPELLPIAVPDVVVQVHEFDSDPPSEGTAEEMGGEPYSLGELDGVLYLDSIAFGQGSRMELTGGRLYFEADSPSMTAAEMRAFAESLEARGGDPKAGFDLASDDYEEVFEVEGPLVNVYATSSRWSGAWQLGDDEYVERSISVERLTFEQFQWRLMASDRTEFTVLDLERGYYFGVRTGLWPLPAGGVMHFEPSTNILTTFSGAETLEEAQKLMDDLRPVDLETWKTLVAPVNADPLRPR